MNSFLIVGIICVVIAFSIPLIYHYNLSRKTLHSFGSGVEK